jgi:DNA-binding transcriptional LysR family regulator
MNQLLAMRAFRCLVEAQGFSAAAERLDTTHSSVSRHLQQLERELGARLLNRTTRQLSLTGAGQEYYLACVDILDRVDAAAQVAAGQQAPSGRLRVSLPMVLGTLELGHWLPGFQAAYPMIELELCCSDRFVDLVAEGFDVALRISEPLPDSSLIARTLGVSPMILVAAPGYAQRLGAPANLAELGGHSLLGYSGQGEWKIYCGQQQVATLKPGNGLRTDSITSLHAAVMAGAGIAAFTASTVLDDLRAGRLLRVLPGHSLGDRHYSALYPHSQHLAGKTKAFVEFMTLHYRTRL